MFEIYISRLLQPFFISHFQKCEMIFGSWTYSAQEVKLKWYIFSPDFKHADLSNYEPSGQWDLVEVPAKIEEKHHTYQGYRSSQNYSDFSNTFINKSAWKFCEKQWILIFTHFFNK